MRKIQSKVTIIGSGPGGMIASLFLSKAKIHHLILDKAIFPRDKVCGENLDGRVFHTLNRLDENILPELIDKGLIKQTRNFSIHVPKGKIPINFADSSTPRLLAKRIDFDHYLFEKVRSSEYCEVIEGEYITDYTYSGKNIVFHSKDLEVESNLGIIACGYQSGLLKNREVEKQIYFFNRTYYKGLKTDNPNRVETYYFNSPVKTCLLICPLPNGEFNVEIGVKKEDYKRLKIRLEEYLEQKINTSPELKAKFENAEALGKPKGVHLPIANTYKLFSDRNLMYTGAASFCVNPITGMGVGNAMVMGEIAAQEAIACLEKDDFSFDATLGYAKQVKKRLRNVMYFNAYINFFFKNLDYTAPLLTLAIRSKFIAKIISQSDFIKNWLSPKFYLKKLFAK